MALTASYGALLKRYTPEKLIENEFAKHSYIYANCEKDTSWRGGTYEIPLFEAGFSSMAYGAFTASNDIAEMDIALGTQTMKELSGSVLVREADLYRHGDMEQSYLKIMPERIQEFVKFMQGGVSSGFLAGNALSKATANGDSSGNITVDKIFLFRKGMKVAVDDDNDSEATGYIRSVNVNTKVITIYDARTGGAVVDLSGYTTAQNALVRHIGAGSEHFTSLPEYLLPAANGGLNTIYGKTRADYTVLQAMVASGAAFTASTLADDLLGTIYGFQETRGDVFKEAWVSFGMFKNLVLQLELTKRATITEKKAGIGWASIDILGAEGTVKIVALREMPNDKIYFGDVKNVKFAGAEPFKRKLYNGEEFFMVRGTTGPEMISDMLLRGDWIIKPAQWGVVHSVPASVST